MFDRSRTPPVAAQQPHTLTAHGHERQDPYFWLSERDSGAVLDHLHAENDYTQAVMAPLALLQKQLYAEMRARYKEDEQSPPYKDGEYWYYERNIEGSEYPVYARRHLTLDAPEEVLLDVNVIAAEHEYCAVRGLEVSPDHRRLAYAVDTVGNRQYVLYLVELTTGRLLAEPLSATAPGVVWTADNDNVFVVRNDATTLRPYELVLYGVSADAESLWQEQDDTYGLFINATRSEDYVQLMSLSTMSTEVGLIPTAAPRTPVETFLPRQRGHEYYLDHDGEQFFVLSNREAKNFQLMATVSPGTPAAAWREILPHDPAVLLETFVLFESAIVVQEKENGLTTYRVIDRASGASQHVTFAESAWLTDLRDNVDYRATTLRLDYESMTTPPSVVDIHLATLERTPVYQEAVLGDFDPAQYRVERVHVPARDGTAVPVSIVARRDRGSEQPLLLYAYGSYSIAIDAGFSHTRLSLLERGFARAIAHVRGGDDLGRGWYEAGR
ncbi:MAG: oligopeptidase B, partial [Pseudomonadota bacterium]